MAKKIIFIICTIISLTICFTLIFSTVSDYKIYKRERANNDFEERVSEFAKISFNTNDAVKILLDDENSDVFISRFITYSQPGNITYAPYDYEYDGYAEVSENYFNYFDIVDTNGQKVEIDKNTVNGILLVPEHYKDEEKGLLEYYKEVRENALSKDLENNIETSSSPDINIYYIKDEQVTKTFDNYHVNNIINVVTNKNIIYSTMNFSTSYIYAYKGESVIEVFKDNFINNTLTKYDLQNNVSEVKVATDSNDSLEQYYFRLVILHSIFIIVFSIFIVAILYFGKNLFRKYKYNIIICFIVIVAFLMALLIK